MESWDNGTLGELKRLIQEQVHCNPEIENIFREHEGNVEEVFSALEEKGLVHELYKTILDFEQKAPVEKTPQVPLTEGDVVLRVLRGKAFLDHIHVKEFRDCYLQLHIFGGSTRFRSKMVPIEGTEHEWAETFRIRNVWSPGVIRILVVREWAKMKMCEVISAHELPLIKCNGRQIVELFGVGKRERIPVGLLEIDALFNAMPAPPARDESLLACFEALDRLQERAKEQGKRITGLCARTENGVIMPCTDFVRTINASRHFQTPHHCLRFCSIIPPNTGIDVESSSVEDVPRWRSWDCVLATRTASAQERALLLCGLFLGLNLDAYVCLGIDSEGIPSVYVLTPSVARPILWDTINGKTIDTGSPERFRVGRIDIAFNAHRVCVNPATSIARTDMRLHGWEMWERPHPPKMEAPSLKFWDTEQPSAEDIEEGLRTELATHRTVRSLDTQWDSSLEPMLDSILWFYEHEHTFGAMAERSIGPKATFDSMAASWVHDGGTISCFPIQFNHTKTGLFFPSMIKHKTFMTMLTQDGAVSFSLRVLVNAFPEDMVTIWIVVCARTK